jgi:hypothetical protein
MFLQQMQQSTFLNEDRFTFFSASAAVCPATTCKENPSATSWGDGWTRPPKQGCMARALTLATGRRLYAMDLMPVSLKEASPA